MLRGLWELTWLETKIFAREPMGLIGTVAIPVVTFLFLGRLFAGRSMQLDAAEKAALVRVEMPVLASILICLSAVLSLVTIIAIYRESGILKRLRATPLRPHTILTAQVLVKLLFTLITMALLLVAGKRYYPVPVDVPIASFALALVISTVAILSIGFLIASLVPTARFAQPIASLIFYPMIGLSGLFVPLASLPPSLRLVARLLPITYVTSLLKGMWQGAAWSAHWVDLAALLVTFVVCTTLSSKVFRWE
jgi:ABC-2 type transport system permease protein